MAYERLRRNFGIFFLFFKKWKSLHICTRLWNTKMTCYVIALFSTVNITMYAQNRVYKIIVQFVEK